MPTDAATAHRSLPRAALLFLALLIIVVDQATKAWLRQTVAVGETIPLWPGVFQITHTQNFGMAFSLLQGATPLLAVAALAVVTAILGALYRAGRQVPLVYGLALALPLGGAIGNLTDRLRLGYVTDLLDFRLINFPVFNIADSAITIGIALLALYLLRSAESDETAITRHAPGTAGAASVEGNTDVSRSV